MMRDTELANNRATSKLASIIEVNESGGEDLTTPAIELANLS